MNLVAIIILSFLLFVSLSSLVVLVMSYLKLKDVVQDLRTSNTALKEQLDLENNENIRQKNEFDNNIEQFYETANKTKELFNKQAVQLQHYETVIKSYTDLFKTTSEDITTVIKYLDTMSSREIITSDPEILTMVKIIKSAEVVLSQYINAFNENEENKGEESVEKT